MRRVNLLHAHGSPTTYLYRLRRDPCRCVVCRAAVAQVRRKHRDADPDKSLAHDRKYREENRAKLKDRKHRSYMSHREQSAAQHLQRKYGMSGAARDELLASQGGVCAIHGGELPSGQAWHTDHDHKTGKVRGILCHHCNVGLGNFRDDPARLMAAIEYLAAATP